MSNRKTYGPDPRENLSQTEDAMGIISMGRKNSKKPITGMLSKANSTRQSQALQ